jgi:hypothetical protein
VSFGPRKTATRRQMAVAGPAQIPFSFATSPPRPPWGSVGGVPDLECAVSTRTSLFVQGVPRPVFFCAITLHLWVETVSPPDVGARKTIVSRSACTTHRLCDSTPRGSVVNDSQRLHGHKKSGQKAAPSLNPASGASGSRRPTSRQGRADHTPHLSPRAGSKNRRGCSLP